ncbi:MAG: elongation factor 1-beta [Candidatus Altiarchaeota archaeon]|nr:elongation factor 1-beta [Candidatus Altiarchaeota archaeon]
MGDVVAKIRVMPENGVTLDEVKESLAFAKAMEEKPIAFGLVALEILVRVSDEDGGFDTIEKQLDELKTVSSYEVLELGRI